MTTQIKSRFEIDKNNLQDADLRYANLRNADLQDADLRYANLRNANLRYANLRNANLRYADLRYVNLRGVNLQDANLQDANLQDAKNINTSEIKRRAICPLSGEFIAWKKSGGGEIVKLKIPAFARRVSPVTGRKCRAEFAIVLEIEDNDKKASYCVAGHDKMTVYRVGEFVSPDRYDASPIRECSHGIHFFITRQEAVDW